jgi:hypothetical protein
VGASAECLRSSECPAGTQCVLFYWAGKDSRCVYNVDAEIHRAHVAPTCATDADCASALALPVWRRVLGEDDVANAIPKARCRDVSGDPAHRRACSIPGFGDL